VIPLLSGCMTVGIQVILVLSVNVLSRYGRQISLGQAAFAGIGAYLSAFFTVYFHVPFWLSCPLSMLTTGALGVGLGLPVLRQGRYYMPVMTLTFNVLVHDWLQTGPLRNGAFGLGHLSPPELFGSTISPVRYVLLVGLAIIGCLVAEAGLRYKILGQRPDGRRVKAGKPQARRDSTLGVIGVSTAMAGLAGSLFAHYESFIGPFDFNLEASLFILALAALGGLGSVRAGMLSAVLLGGLIESIPLLTAYRFLITGVVLLIVGLWWPQDGG
jgi:branched-chain amino acid transport system permease protein